MAFLFRNHFWPLISVTFWFSPRARAGVQCSAGWRSWRSGLRARWWQETRSARRSLLSLAPHRVLPPTLQPPRGPWFSSSYRKYVIEIEAEEGPDWGFFFILFFAAGSSSHRYLCTGLDHNHRVKKRSQWSATASFSQHWSRMLSLLQLWGLPAVLNALEVTLPHACEFCNKQAAHSVLISTQPLSAGKLNGGEPIGCTLEMENISARQREAVNINIHFRKINFHQLIVIHY